MIRGFVLFFVLALELFGQYHFADLARFEKFLLPIDLVRATQPSAFGSVWDTRVVLHNSSDTPVEIAHGIPTCQVCPGAGGIIRLPARTTQRGRKDIDVGNAGSLWYLERGRRQDVTISSRLAELTRAGDQGVDLPVVFEEHFFRGGTRRIIDIPATPSARRMLRVYEVDASEGARFVVRIIHEQTNAERSFVLTAGRTGGAEYAPYGFAFFPAYAQLPFDGPETAGSYRVEITPENPAARWWALVSVTDNETQRVTLATSKQ